MTNRHPAAHINIIAESGTKEEAVQYLQQTWNELCDAKAERESLRDALDNSQSLLAMLLHLGADEDGHGIMPAVWQNENLSKLLEDQVSENRLALSDMTKNRKSKA